MDTHAQSIQRRQSPASEQQSPCRVIRQGARLTPAVLLAAVFVVTLVGIAVLHFVGTLLRWMGL